MNEEDIQQICTSLDGITRALLNLGNANASTPMGAIEAYGVVSTENAATVAGGLEQISTSLDDVATNLDHVATSLEHIARAINLRR